MVISDREKFSLLLGINMAVMEMMYAFGLRSGQMPKKDFLQERVTEILSEVCSEQNLKISQEDFAELVPECYKTITITNDMTERLLMK